jgi:hypothetical protein
VFSGVDRALTVRSGLFIVLYFVCPYVFPVYFRVFIVFRDISVFIIVNTLGYVRFPDISIVELNLSFVEESIRYYTVYYL